jgi:prepilin-type processing-associated H-X9-DG protein
MYIYDASFGALPRIDNQELYSACNKQLPYFSPLFTGANPSNLKISNTAIAILRCPDDINAQPGNGNLSYVVNGGFSLNLWDGTCGVITPPGQFSYGNLNWTQGVVDDSVTRKLGVMHLGTTAGNFPWDARTTPSGIFDGASTTLLLSENVLAGASGGSAYSGSKPTNWASPWPTYVMFNGSHHVCEAPGQYTTSASLNCYSVATLAPVGGTTTGPSWGNANQQGNSENINFGLSEGIEGGFPYTNSGHPGVFNAVFCDGSVRTLSSTINGVVYASIITPAGSKLPSIYKQMPVDGDAIQ